MRRIPIRRGIHQITIRRDEEYNLVAVAEGDYVETEECQLEEGTLIKESVLKGIWNHYYNASLINCFAKNLTTKMMTENNREDAKIVLKLLHYQGPYINWSKPGHPREEL